MLALPADAQVLIASDMHLGEHDPATAEWFCTELEEQVLSAAATQAQASYLILLGDLFEAWVGDDQRDKCAQKLVELIRLIAKSTPVFVMRGNRDFLLNVPLPTDSGAQQAPASFSQQTGASMLADPCVLTVAGRRWVLTHGDVLCTDDTAYQDFRNTSRTDRWQREFLMQPLGQRMALATQMRAQSEKEKSNKSAYLTDVSPQAVQACLTANDSRSMIHGHTHRPNQHQWTIDGVDYVRNVLPDWDYEARTGAFGLLNRDGLKLQPTSRPSDSNQTH